METRMDRSDVDMMLGIAPCQDCEDGVFPALMHIDRQLTAHEKLTVTPKTTHWGSSWIDYELHVFDCCTKCGSRDSAYASRGLCNRCRHRQSAYDARRAAWEGRAA